MSKAADSICMWCRKEFIPRRDGGKAQRFCRPACRRDFDAAGRRWVAYAITIGTLTVNELKNGLATTRALLPTSSSLVAMDETALRHPALLGPCVQSSYTQQLVLERAMAQAIETRRR